MLRHASSCECEDCNPTISLTKNEARAIVKELGATFIDRENPLCNEVLNKLIRFVNDK